MRHTLFSALIPTAETHGRDVIATMRSVARTHVIVETQQPG